MNKTISHELKIDAQHLYDIHTGDKTFEIRINDRDFQLYQYIRLKQIIGGDFTGKSLIVKIVYISDYMQREGYVVLGIKIE